MLKITPPSLPSSLSETAGTFVAGYRFRSDIGSHNRISEMLGTKVVSIELASKVFLPPRYLLLPNLRDHGDLLSGRPSTPTALARFQWVI